MDMDNVKMAIPHKMIDIVKGTTAKLAYSKGGKLYYKVRVGDYIYTFPIDVTDRAEVGDARFELEDKASIFMRYINKAIKALDGEDSDAMIRWDSVVGRSNP
jgi:hypothetical protein